MRSQLVFILCWVALILSICVFASVLTYKDMDNQIEKQLEYLRKNQR